MAETPKQDSKQDDKQVTVVMVGASYDAKNGEERTVDKATAERLVANGVARYPASK